MWLSYACNLAQYNLVFFVTEPLLQIFRTQTNNTGWKSIRVEDATIVNWTLTLLLRSSVHSVNIIIMVWVINRGGGICGPYHVLTGLTFSLLSTWKQWQHDYVPRFAIFVRTMTTTNEALSCKTLSKLASYPAYSAVWWCCAKPCTITRLDISSI